MLYNEAREPLVREYEETYHAEGIAKVYSVSKWTVYQMDGPDYPAGNRPL